MRSLPAVIIGLLLVLTLAFPIAAQDATPVADATPEPADALQSRVSTSSLYWSEDTAWANLPVPGSLSSLATFPEGASFTLTTSGLEAGHTFTIWWIIFNNPEHCTHGMESMRCGEGDLLIAGGDPDVEGTAVFATGHVIGPDGSGYFDAFLATGDTTYVLGMGPGLTNPTGAEIHFVVRTHGPVQPGLVAEQVTTFGGGCNNAPDGPGAPGDFPCTDLQYAVHIQ
jgi:hypothetical protein